MARKQLKLNKNTYTDLQYNSEIISNEQHLEEEKNNTKKNKPLSVELAFSFFISEQRARGNSEYTIKYYDRFYKKLLLCLSDLTKLSFDEAKTVAVTVLNMPQFTTVFADSINGNIQTKNSYLRALKAFSKYCAEMGYIEEVKIKIREVEPDIKQVYTDKEIKKLLVKPNIENFTEYRDWVATNFLLGTGVRLQTLIHLKVEDIDLQEGYFYVTTAKREKKARLPLTKKLNRVLNEYIKAYRTDDDYDGTEFLFCNKFDEQMTADGFKKSIHDYNRRHGVQKTSIHLYRHTFAKYYLLGGGDVLTLQKLLLHSSLEMVKRYANIYAIDAKDKVEAFSPLSQVSTTSGKTLKTKYK